MLARWTLDLAPLDPFAMLRDFDRLLESPRTAMTPC
jgi:hypothetical protein